MKLQQIDGKMENYKKDKDVIIEILYRKQNNNFLRSIHKNGSKED